MRLSKHEVKPPRAPLINYRYATVIYGRYIADTAHRLYLSTIVTHPEFIPAIVTVRTIIHVLSKLTIAHGNKHIFFSQSVLSR